jgi:hypothetical protein
VGAFDVCDVEVSKVGDEGFKPCDIERKGRKGRCQVNYFCAAYRLPSPRGTLIKKYFVL